MIWIPLVVLLVSLPAYIVVSERQILRLQRRVTQQADELHQLTQGQVNLTKQVAELEDEVIGLLKPKGNLW